MIGACVILSIPQLSAVLPARLGIRVMRYHVLRIALSLLRGRYILLSRKATIDDWPSVIVTNLRKFYLLSSVCLALTDLCIDFSSVHTFSRYHSGAQLTEATVNPRIDHPGRLSHGSRQRRPLCAACGRTSPSVIIGSPY